jgi:signal transduction histidine kinase
VRELRNTTSRSSGYPPAADATAAERKQRTLRLLTQGYGLLETSAAEFQRRGCILVVAGPDGRLLSSHGLDVLTDDFLRAAFTEGRSWDERDRGINGIGTPVTEGEPVAVIGRAHSDARWHGLACYGAPIRDVDGKVIAILDVTGPVSAADPLIGLTVESLACAFEGLMRVGAMDELANRVGLLEFEWAAARRDREALAETLRLNETFLATVGHDLRNPLSAILHGADLLARAESPHSGRIADRIRSSGRRMVGLIDQLSDLARSRLGGGLGVLKASPVDLAQLAQRMSDEIRAPRADRTILLDKAGDTTGLWDEDRIAQVVSNLIGNALLHGAKDRPIHVNVDGTRADRVVLTVTNAGEIDASILPYVFDAFRSTAQGLGLGLYIVEQVVRAHQGEVEVVSKHGTTTFLASLPRRR